MPKGDEVVEKDGLRLYTVPAALVACPEPFFRQAPEEARAALAMVKDASDLLTLLLKEEPEPAVRVVLGHFIFVYIHPYVDGNGRMGRFLMNTMLASGGYPWTVIPVEQRDAYMAALEAASVDQNIGPFADFLAELVNARL